MYAKIRRATVEKELRMAGASVTTREAIEAKGLTYMGSVGMAAMAGYLTPRACEKLGCPATQAELDSAQHFAMLTDCHVDLCVLDEAGHRRRPCLPVFRRSADEVSS